jgi:hypothetical protein
MAKTFIGLEDTIGPGTLVYESYYPQNPGIVRRVVSDKRRPLGSVYALREVIVEVEWLKPTYKRAKITTVHVMGLHNFENLIEEHERKFRKQSAMADELREMKEK